MPTSISIGEIPEQNLLNNVINYTLRSGMNEMSFAVPLMAASLSFLDAFYLVNIDFGELASIFTGLFQVVIPIAIILFVMGIFALFFPGIRRFLKGLI